MSKHLVAGAVFLAMIALISVARSSDARILLASEGTNVLLQVLGDEDDDWLIQSSADMVEWTNRAAMAPLLSGGTNAPWRVVEGNGSDQQFFRAMKTAGLYDRTLLRTISLTFTQSNWQTLLANGRTTGSNVYCSLLTMNNGATREGVGARYRGNTSYSGFGGGGAPVKKSVNLEMDFSNTNADLMGYSTLNLNNAYMDETIMRESVYFNVMRQYTVCPAACLVQLYINGANWGVYSCAQQENGDLIKEYFPSNDGDRWRAPNMGGGGGPGGGATGSSALGYLGNTNPASYRALYELKSDANTNALPRLIQAIYVLNTTPTNQLRDKVEDVLAVDRWLWFLAVENIFADDDSYWNKGADYCMYYEPESGRLHPVEHDGNEAFVAGDVSLSPVRGGTETARPVLNKLLSIPELRQRYLAHMRTVLKECFNPAAMTPLIQDYHAVSVAAIMADPKKGYTAMSTYTNDLNALKTFVTNRYNYLTNHAELKAVPPEILSVYAPNAPLSTTEVPWITADIRAVGNNGLNSAWLYYRPKSYGRFASVQMFDDGAHGDGAANDSLFGAALTNYPAGTKVRFYVEARSENAAKAAAFSPARAEQTTYSYRVALTSAGSSPVVLNELMAENDRTLVDPQGEHDDWIELHNVTEQEVDLGGRYLSDEPNNPRKWQFPAGTKIAAGGYLIVWADEDGTAASGLHASFKLSKTGEEIFLNDTDASLNAMLDHIAFGPQEADMSYGRTSEDEDVWKVMVPTPGEANR